MLIRWTMSSSSIDGQASQGANERAPQPTRRGRHSSEGDGLRAVNRPSPPFCSVGHRGRRLVQQLQVSQRSSSQSSFASTPFGSTADDIGVLLPDRLLGEGEEPALHRPPHVVADELLVARVPYVRQDGLRGGGLVHPPHRGEVGGEDQPDDAVPPVGYRVLEEALDVVELVLLAGRGRGMRGLNSSTSDWTNSGTGADLSDLIPEIIRPCTSAAKRSRTSLTEK